VIGLAMLTGSDLPAELWKPILTGGLWAVIQWRVVGEVRRFSRWGWYGAMAELAIASATKLVWVFLLPDQAFAFLILLGINVWMMRYFWTRRADFDVDLGT
jgi:hypothetical protein